jgi:hypothetical protein
LRDKPLGVVLLTWIFAAPDAARLAAWSGSPLVSEISSYERLGRAIALKAPIEKSLKKYDTAIASVWVATDPDELRKSIEDLI